MFNTTEALQDIVYNIKIDRDNLQISHAKLSVNLHSNFNKIQIKKIPLTQQLNYLNFHLFKLLHQIYFKGLYINKSNHRIQTNEAILKNIDAEQIDWEFYEKLDKNNQGSFWLHPSFHIVKKEIDGTLIAEFDNGFLQLKRKNHLPTAFQAASIGSPVAIKLPSSFIDQSYYIAIGDNLGGFPPTKKYFYTILIHFNFNSEAAISAMNSLTTELNKLKVMFRFKVLYNPLNYGMYTSGILQVFSYEYDSSLYKKAISPILQTTYKENKHYFNPEIPIFNKLLAPGIGLTERPHPRIRFKHTIDSEVNYCEFIADALLEAYQNNDESPKDRMKYIIKHFESKGVDLNCAYLNSEFEDIYTPLNLDRCLCVSPELLS
ncbi:conserved hypothetical protein [Hyella patelloides LEGE 07179]|uniref:Uncharacterized protein n=1 Tax=Hyella patelloides LEGE 07179 TaxID=945734 RepID=A0A563VUK3_9CYAN|nr:T3SS effector HopA1 family protein [Hyella patelloides]VEP15088.1 conserved hypothetical protein [Hyella patelloides LEGE 07179]